MRMPSVMGHRFSEVPAADLERSAFDRSHGFKFTFDAGYLVPFWVAEILPADTVVVSSTELFGRLATPLKPIMDNLWLEWFYFFIPNRLVWNNWERFQGAQDDPGDSVDFTIPIMSSTGATHTVGSLYDYLGLPPESAAHIAGSYAHNVLQTRGYNLVWNEFFRDQNLQNSVVVDKDDGPDTAADYALLRRGKRHDYFTSCLPFPQKGDAVTLPLGTRAPVAYGLDAVTGQEFGAVDVGSGDVQGITTSGARALVDVTVLGGDRGLFADLSLASAATVNELRQAFQVQKIFERDMRSGTRYVEALKARWRVTSPDARLQRPEYLGGGRARVNVVPVPQTSESAAPPTTVDAQGNLAGFGTVSGHGGGFSKSFVEHGHILALLSVRADLTYSQGIDRQWSRQTRFDFYEPALAHLGEQSVLRKEIYITGNVVNDNLVFGYQERAAEYRYERSRLAGLFRPAVPNDLAIWHLSEEFSAAPTLSAGFIDEDPPIDRVIAVPTEPHFILDGYIRTKWARAMPVFGVPGLIDHF